MHIFQLADGWNFPLFNVIGDFNGKVWAWRSTSPSGRRESSGRWNRSWNGADVPPPFAATTVPKTPAARSKHGQTAAESSFNTFNPVSRSRTLTSSASVAPCATNGCRNTIGTTSTRSGCSRPGGWTTIITAAYPWPWRLHTKTAVGHGRVTLLPVTPKNGGLPGKRARSSRTFIAVVRWGWAE